MKQISEEQIQEINTLINQRRFHEIRIILRDLEDMPENGKK